MSKKMLEIGIVHDSPEWLMYLPEVETLAQKAAQAAFLCVESPEDWPEGVEAAILLSNDEKVRILNRDYRDKDTPTNVLSFPAWEEEEIHCAGEPVLLGDIALALETLRREAEAEKISLEAHFSHLIVHGILHLLGFDHMNDEEAEEMEGLESQIMLQLGFVDPYA